jgi:geranylgeranyl pyrophosphate synthase
MPNLSLRPGLLGFFDRMERRVDEALASVPFDERQRDLLRATMARFRLKTRANPAADPLAFLYLIARAERRAIEQQGELLGGFCQYYLLSLDLMDDVQDADLAGKPHEQAGAAIAINNALTLLFLGLSMLEGAMRLEREPARAMDYLAIVNRVALLTSRGQHSDLLGPAGARTMPEVLDMQRAKTASLTMICEVAALHAHASPANSQRYHAIGQGLSGIVQLVDDLRDIYGKPQSPDFVGSKMTYPMAAFLECANPQQIEQLQALDPKAAGAQKSLRSLLYSSGAVQLVAEAIEQQRRAVHQEVAALEADQAPLRTLLSIVDGLVSTVYAAKPIEESQHVLSPRTPWHEKVRSLAAQFRARLAPFDPPAPPRLVPWHLPQWMYEPRHDTVYYPDIEGLPEDTLTIQATLLGEDDLEKLSRLVAAQAPAVLAHELFHHYRDKSGRLTQDIWLEELAANALATAYCREYEPEALERGLAFSRQALERPENVLSPRAGEILEELFDPARPVRVAPSYEVDMHHTAVIQLAMIERLAARPESLRAAVSRYLGRVAPAPDATCGVSG